MSSRISRGRVTAAAATIVAIAGSSLAFASPAAANFSGDDNGDIAFSTTSSRSVYVASQSGGGATALLSSYPFKYDDVSYSADGTKVVYVSNEFSFDKNPEGNDELWMADATGANRVQLTMTGSGVVNRDPSWSPNGTRIVFVSNNFPNYQGQLEPELAIMDATQGATMTKLTANGKYDEADPVFSPSGLFIAYAAKRNVPGYTATPSWDIFTMTSTGGSDEIMENMSQEPYVDELNPDWSPDGKEVVFSRTLSQNGASKIVVSKRDGSNERTLDEGLGDGTDPVFSPDGSAIAYVATNGGSSSIRAMSAADGSAGVHIASFATDTVARPSWQVLSPNAWTAPMTPVFGDSLKLQDNADPDKRYLKVVMVSPEINTIGSALRQGSATLRVDIDGQVSEYVLPLDKWIPTIKKNAEDPHRYRYIDGRLTTGPVRQVVIDMVKGKITLTGVDAGLTHSFLTQPNLVKVEFIAGEMGFCAHFGGDTVKYTDAGRANSTRTLIAKDAAAPASC